MNRKKNEVVNIFKMELKHSNSSYEIVLASKIKLAELHFLENCEN